MISSNRFGYFWGKIVANQRKKNFGGGKLIEKKNKKRTKLFV